MKKYWFTVLLTIIAIFAIGGTIAAASADTNSPRTVAVSESGKQITLSPGDSLVVTLNSNETTGYSWNLSAISHTDVIHKVSDKYVEPTPSTPPVMGQGGQEVWTFNALSKGTSTIEMKYVRPWETGVEPAATFNVTVVVK
jgi:inhibitor of cysteine peptidase